MSIIIGIYGSEQDMHLDVSVAIALVERLGACTRYIYIYIYIYFGISACLDFKVQLLQTYLFYCMLQYPNWIISSHSHTYMCTKNKIIEHGT